MPGMKHVHNILKDKNILIVEYDETTILLIQQLLRQTDANIISVSSKPEIEDIIKSDIDIDMVIMDIPRHNVMNGVEFIEIVKTTYPLAHVIVETAITLPGLEQKCCERGCDAFFLKPWSCDDLLNSIKELCANIN